MSKKINIYFYIKNNILNICLVYFYESGMTKPLTLCQLSPTVKNNFLINQSSVLLARNMLTNICKNIHLISFSLITVFEKYGETR